MGILFISVSVGKVAVSIISLVSLVMYQLIHCHFVQLILYLAYANESAKRQFYYALHPHLISDPRRAVPDCEVVGVEVDLHPRERDLEGAPVRQPRVTRPASCRQTTRGGEIGKPDFG